MMKKRRMPFPLYNAALCALAVLAAVLLCLCVQAAEDRYYLKWDVSPDGMTILSDYTLARLAALDQDVTLYSVHTPGVSSTVYDRQMETMRRMASVCSRVTVAEIDPISQPQRLLALSGDLSAVRDGTVFVQNGEGMRIIRIDPDSFVFSRTLDGELYTIYCGEARLIGAIDQVCTDSPVSAWFIAGHGEASETDCAQLALQMRAMGMEVSGGTLSLLDPRPGDVLLLLGPQNDFTEAEAQRLLSLTDSGVHLLIACGADTPFASLPTLASMLDVLGLSFRPGWVVENVAESRFYVDRPELLSPALAEPRDGLEALPGRLILPRACAMGAPALRPGITAEDLLITSGRAVLRADPAGDAYAASPADVSGQMALAQLFETEQAQILALASDEMLRDDAGVLDVSENLSFLAACLANMTDRGDGATLDAGVKRIPAQLIAFDSAQTRQWVSAVLLFALPTAIVLVMAAVLLKRRRL